MHHAAFQYVESKVKAHGPFKRVVEIGARWVNGSVRPLFHCPSYTGVDIAPGLGVDVVADGATYQPAEAPDCVVCCEVLEHTDSAAAIVANARAMLASGGCLIVTCAGRGRAPHSAVDGNALRPGEFYRNIEAADLLAWLEGMIDVEVRHVAELGDLYGCARKP